MNHFIRLLFVLTPLFFFVYYTHACLCTKNLGVGKYCGGELSFTGGGSDCGSETLWNCTGRGKVAEALSPCVFGCCGITGKPSACCSETGCPGCSEPSPPYSPQIPTSTISNTSNIPIPSISSTIPKTSSPPAKTLPPSETLKIVIGAVSGIAGTALIIVIGIFGYKWNQRRRQNQDDIMRIPGNNIQSQNEILRIPGNNTKTRIV
ncbi:hypothetical protein RirG_093640 [Rhizophagus irregularis DAOM 197198w]|uniref:Uncharacterized protein n=1 Tax=Rhizophagus irregularis (strain DAOM 197198w) TaxID=1432141 RepID=A0A015MSN2_RHIIW|nr:hypothetical protein RirG_093640 [Rhizophagus irregularis DAOM 197198w]